MYKIINQYLIVNYLKIVANAVLIFLALGIILNLFEEIEFFKGINASPALPYVLSLSFVPTLIIDLLPFIIFLSSMFYFLQIKTNKDLLFVKVFGYSNLKILIIIAFFTFIFGCAVLLAANPITSALVKYYETEKAKYARDVDHLISVNKNGVWIKENRQTGYVIISAKNLEANYLKKISIYVFNNDGRVLKRIEAETAEISSNPWKLNNGFVYDFVNKDEKTVFKEYEFKTEKILDKINSLYKNLNTVSFIELIKNYSQLNDIGYSKKLLDKKMHIFISLPFFLFLMVVLAAIFTIGNVNSKQNYYYVIMSILASVIIYYFKDLSIALGQTEKIGLILSVWMPIIVLGLFCSIGVIQINEK
jgi:lipopolysaccharide export system permease protein